MNRNPDPLEKELRQAMHERWDGTPVPRGLNAQVRVRLQKPSPFRRALNFAGALTGVALLATLVLTFSALLDRRPVQTAVTQIVVTRAAITPVTQVVPSIIEQTRQPFTEPHPILGDVRVRQAIAYCTNRAELLRSVYPWLTDTAPFEADTVVPRNHWAYPAESPQFQRYPFDVTRGQTLLAEAGWAQAEGQPFRTNANGDELALTLTTTNAQFRQTWASVWEAQLAACGIRIVRLHAPAEWLFGDSTGLRRRDFEMAAFAWVADYEPGGRELWACAAAPTLANDWQGQNYAGWCNITADAAIQQFSQSFNRAERRAAYQTFQAELSKDVPVLPLFFRASVSAINPELENFAPDVNSAEPFTWNAAQWRLPGKGTLIIGESSEPASLFVNETAYVSQVIGALIFGRDVAYRNYEFQPLTLPELPTLENGGAVENVVLVKEGAAVIDSIGQPITLAASAVVRDAAGNEVVYTGGELALPQLTVTYNFFETLTWSDGVPVSRADYELAYKIICDPETGTQQFIGTNPTCDQIASVEFLSNTAYRVIWKPGFRDALYSVPPLGRQPAHQILSDGRRLADVPPAEWLDLPEVNERPLGIGPYILTSWVHGEGLKFIANPYYFAGPPATPQLEIRIRETNLLPAALISGEIDVIGLDSTFPTGPTFQTLVEAQAQGKVRILTTPADTWEHVDFALFLK
jgi:ABC-type transport system substrate-binding protein